MQQLDILVFGQMERDYSIGLTNIFINACNERLFRTFDNIEAEAECAMQDTWKLLNERFGYEGGPDEADIAEWAEDHGVRIYSDLKFAQSWVIGLAAAGVYHFLERILKEFLVREIPRHKSKIQGLSFPGIVKFFENFGWRIENEPFYDEIRVLSLVANTIKHGDGGSCDELGRLRPELFMGEWQKDGDHIVICADNLNVTEDAFANFAAAVLSFWKNFPDGLTCKS